MNGSTSWNLPYSEYCTACNCLFTLRAECDVAEHADTAIFAVLEIERLVEDKCGGQVVD